MNKCIDCGLECCVCTVDSLFEDEEASDYIDMEQDLKRLQLPNRSHKKNVTSEARKTKNG